MKYFCLVIFGSAAAAVVAVFISKALEINGAAIIGGGVGGAVAAILATKLKK